MPLTSLSLFASSHYHYHSHSLTQHRLSRVTSHHLLQSKKPQPPYARSPASDGEEECTGGRHPEPVASEPVAAELVASEGGASKRGASVNWASLKADGPLHKIGNCLLANEEYVDTYSALRQVCTNWRSDLPEPDVHLHEWIMVEHALPRAADFTFLHLRTSRYVTIDLTEVHARFKFLHIYRVNLFLFSIINILVLNVIFINIF